MKTIDLVSLFPDAVRSVLDSSILRRAQVQGKLALESTDLRSFSDDKYRSVDDTPFGGQQGMLFTAPVLHRAAEAQLAQVGGDREKLKILYPSPRGLRLGQPVFEVFAEWLAETPDARLAVFCGRYEGVDERFVERWVDMEFSLGDFVLTGGELPGLVFTDGVVRLMPGVLGDDRSAREESFSAGLLEHPQYTKPRDFMGQLVPEDLLTGHHAKMNDWKIQRALMLTATFRPDLIRDHHGAGLPLWAKDLLQELKRRLDLRA
ncbi:MAG: tRNA (guanosine(37)-N1)-methyltransferase TrmD [Bdellovibrionales bacterium]|nr:tRNA (guanosine(37)-N1)-methyltransferase TrmD [Bdellovibrionales bacterium]